MFALHRAKRNWRYFKKEDIKDIWGVVFEPDNHELRFYQMMFDIRAVENAWWLIDHYEMKVDGEWKHICIWDLIVRWKDGKDRFYTRDYWHARWEFDQVYSMYWFDCVEWIIIQDDEWDMYLVRSRWTSWYVYETFFIQEYHRLQDEYAEKDSMDWFYDELEKRTFTHIEHKEFLDLTTC